MPDRPEAALPAAPCEPSADAWGSLATTAFLETLPRSRRRITTAEGGVYSTRLVLRSPRSGRLEGRSTRRRFRRALEHPSTPPDQLRGSG